MSAIEIASLFATLDAKDKLNDALDNADRKIQSVGDSLKSLESGLSNLGGGITTLAAPLGVALGASIKGAFDFNETMTNTGAVMGKNAEQMRDLSNQVLELGMNSRVGADATAAAFYDIVGGVADASTHMDILKTSLDVSAAGSANLDGVVSALVKTMNIYGLGAEDAARAGDVLTRAVGVGVGTMDEFAAALPPVEGLAQSLGISFDELGGYMAYMSTKSSSVAAGGTQLRGVLSKIINPSKELGDAIKAMGYASGSTLVKQEGLIGALNKIKGFNGGSFEGLIADQEALLGAMALTANGADQFFTTYKDGIDGATTSAKDIQMASPAAQFDLLMNSIKGTGIAIGETLLPTLNDLMQSIRPVIQNVLNWVQANPELTRQIAMLVGGFAIAGPVILGIGKAIGAVTSIISGIGGVIGFVFSPIGLLVAGLAALGVAFATNFGGIRDLLQPIVDNVVGGVQTLIGVLGNFGAIVERQGLGDAVGYVINAFAQMLGLVPNDDLLPGVLDFGNGIVTTLQNIATFVTENVLPVLGQLANWFINDALPAVVNFVTGTVVPTLQEFWRILGEAWTVVGPALESVARWFVGEALPGVVNFVTGTVVPAIEDFFNFVGQVWESVRPGLEAFANWFITDGLPGIRDFVQDVFDNVITPFFNFVGQVWETVRPALESFGNWFVTEGLPGIRDTVQDVFDNVITPFFEFLQGAWDLISPALEDIFAWFQTNGMPFVKKAVEEVGKVVGGFITTLSNIWTSVSGPLTSLKDGIMRVLGPVAQTIADIKAGFDSLAGMGQIQGQAKTATSGVNNAQLFSEVSKQAQGSGLGIFSDLGARIAFAGLRAEGGEVEAGKSYIVGERGPELFFPRAGGMISPNGAGGGGGGGVSIGNVVINANSEAEGEAAAKGFTKRIREELLASGMA